MRMRAVVLLVLAACTTEPSTPRPTTIPPTGPAAETETATATATETGTGTGTGAGTGTNGGGSCGPMEAFRMYYGNPLSGIDVLEIDAAGAATYWVTEHYRRGNVNALRVHEHHFTLDAATLTALHDTLDRIGFCQLDPRYTANMYDGVQGSYSVWSGGVRHRVYCDNQFPPQIRELQLFLRDSVLPAEQVWMRAPEAQNAVFQDAIRRAE